jgi:hypothetical protein
MYIVKSGVSQLDDFRFESDFKYNAKKRNYHILSNGLIFEAKNFLNDLTTYKYYLII